MPLIRTQPFAHAKQLRGLTRTRSCIQTSILNTPHNATQTNVRRWCSYTRPYSSHRLPSVTPFSHPLSTVLALSSPRRHHATLPQPHTQRSRSSLCSSSSLMLRPAFQPPVLMPSPMHLYAAGGSNVHIVGLRTAHSSHHHRSADATTVDPASPSPASTSSPPLTPSSTGHTPSARTFVGRLRAFRAQLQSLVPESILQAASLVKFELSVVVTLSSAYGYALAGATLHTFPLTVGIANIVGTLACAFGAAILNQYRETEFDRMMPRTKHRPLVTGYFTPRQALTGAAALGVGGTLILHAAAGDVMAPLFGAGTLVLYATLYTSLKRMTRYNTEVGALIGAMPVLIGWSCTVAYWSHHVATMHAGSIYTAITPLQSLILPHAAIGYLVLIAWQMQHFMTIAFQYQDAYEYAGYKMIKGEAAINKGIGWCGVLCGIPLVSTWLGVTSAAFIALSAAPNALLLALFIQMRRKLRAGDMSGAKKTSRLAMLYGVAYLIIFGALMVVCAFDNKYFLIRTSLPKPAEGHATKWCIYKWGGQATIQPLLMKTASAQPALPDSTITKPQPLCTDPQCAFVTVEARTLKQLHPELREEMESEK